MQCLRVKGRAAAAAAKQERKSQRGMTNVR